MGVDAGGFRRGAARLRLLAGALLVLGGCARSIELSHPGASPFCLASFGTALQGADSALLGEYEVSTVHPRMEPSTDTGRLVLNRITGDSAIGYYEARDRREPALLRGETLWIGCVLEIGCFDAGPAVYTLTRRGAAGFWGRWRYRYDGYAFPSRNGRVIRAVSGPFCARRRDARHSGPS